MRIKGHVGGGKVMRGEEGRGVGREMAEETDWTWVSDLRGWAATTTQNTIQFTLHIYTVRDESVTRSLVMFTLSHEHEHTHTLVKHSLSIVWPGEGRWTECWGAKGEVMWGNWSQAPSQPSGLYHQWVTLQGCPSETWDVIFDAPKSHRHR